MTQLWSHINVVLNKSTVSTNYSDVDISHDVLNIFFRMLLLALPISLLACFHCLLRMILGLVFSLVGFLLILSLDTSTLDVQKSIGLDGLSPRFLKEIIAKIAVPFNHLYNLSF